MAATYPAFGIKAVVPLKDKDYYWYALDLIRAAAERIWVSMFLIDIRRAFDPDAEVRELLHALRDASWRGVNVRVMTGDSRTLFQLREMNMVSRAFLRMMRLAVKTHPAGRRGGMHDKYLVIDRDVVVLGSHNWLHECFNETSEDSVAVYSPDLNYRQSQEFLAAWNRPTAAGPRGNASPTQPEGL